MSDLANDIGRLRNYEAETLRTRWNYISSDASARAEVLNWIDAPAEAWVRVDCETYADMVVKWAIQVSNTLQAADPEGTSKAAHLESLRFNYRFHVEKMVHLQKLGLSVAQPPSELQAAGEGLKEAVLKAPFTLGKWAKWGAVLAAVVLLVPLVTEYLRSRRSGRT